jgi:hypothetical protein
MIGFYFWRERARSPPDARALSCSEHPSRMALINILMFALRNIISAPPLARCDIDLIFSLRFTIAELKEIKIKHFKF